MEARLAVPDDADAIRAFDCAHSPRGYVTAVQRGVTHLADEVELGDSGSSALLMFHEGELVGIVCYQIQEDPDGVVYWISFAAVATAFQGQKHAKTLVRTMEAHLISTYGTGRVSFRLDSRNDESVGLCQSMGFTLEPVPGRPMYQVTDFF